MTSRHWRATVASGLALVSAGIAWVVASILQPTARAGAAGMRRFASGWRSRPGARQRDLRRRASRPLPNLYEVHPDARAATPREIGLRSLDLDEIVGTAVGGLAQRGSDFKPLPAFRSSNWEGRWQRIRSAIDRLAILPPIDVVRFPPGGGYWVLDGHNRVAAALDVGQVAIDANVTELVPPGQNATERPDNLAAALTGTRSLRAAGQGGRLQTVEDDVVLGVPTPGLPDARRSPGAPDEPPHGT
ncbi:MAG TPA: ParB/Srx family N-terminal domain-containing protein [Vitreimonas sp.]|nr:ParB/Srx family N-terminal domain-containing protein [Vitreimonas sp.]